eukprot:2185147-Pleurochrysis_carterae.AAC.1
MGDLRKKGTPEGCLQGERGGAEKKCWYSFERNARRNEEWERHGWEEVREGWPAREGLGREDLLQK